MTELQNRNTFSRAPGAVSPMTFNENYINQILNRSVENQRYDRDVFPHVLLGLRGNQLGPNNEPINDQS